MKRFIATLIILIISMGLVGCLFEKFDDSDLIISTDKTVDSQTTQRITSYLLSNVPLIRQEKEKLASGKEKVKLIVRVENAPDPEHPKADPDAVYHINYYWIYVGYHSQDKIIKYYRYLVHKDINEILFYNDENDQFEKINK